ncbi:MAG: ATP synthase F0 subunit C [Planctomycetes bacterium]|nr:ATP synthase F0 subunit C [Planctomycetota bacterium]
MPEGHEQIISSLFGGGVGPAHFAAGIGAGLCLIGAAYGISKIAAAAMDGTARQPEAGNAIRTGMIIASALIEGLGLVALTVCLLLALK